MQAGNEIQGLSSVKTPGVSSRRFLRASHSGVTIKVERMSLSGNGGARKNIFRGATIEKNLRGIYNF